MTINSIRLLRECVGGKNIYRHYNFTNLCFHHTTDTELQFYVIFCFQNFCKTCSKQTVLVGLLPRLAEVIFVLKHYFQRNVQFFRLQLLLSRNTFCSLNQLRFIRLEIIQLICYWQVFLYHYAIWTFLENLMPYLFIPVTYFQ